MATTIPAPLAGKVAIVTGGTRGIGACLAKTLAQQGCTRVAITYLSNKDMAEATCEAIEAFAAGIKPCAIHADLKDPEFGDQVVQSALIGLEVDHIDIAISSAVFSDYSIMAPAATIRKLAWDEVATMVTWGPLSLARAASRVMPRGGRVIFLSSIASRLGDGELFTSYAASKAALEAVSKSLARDWSVSKGITVNSISVGGTWTETLRKGFDTMPGFQEHVESLPILKRVGETQEVADIIAFVASPQASWLTGNLIPANGGAMTVLQG